MPFDGEEFGKTIVAAVNDSIERSLAPLLKRLDALESFTQQTIDNEKMFDRQLETLGQTVSSLSERPDAHGIKSMVDDVRAGLESVMMPEMQVALSVMVAEAVKAIPVPVAPELPDIAGMIDDAVKAIPPARDGKDADQVDVAAIADQVRASIVLPELPDIAGMVAEAVKTIPVPAAPELPDIVGMVNNAVSKAVEAIPAPKDGKDADQVDMDAVKAIIIEVMPPAPELPDIAGMVAEAVKAIPVPVAPELPDIAGMIDDAVKAIPAPKDGKSVTIDDVHPLINEAVSKAVEAIPAPKDGKDGVDAVEAMINRDGDLIFTFSNGKAKNVGRVVGDDGVDCDINGVWEILNEKLAALPPPKDGVDGLGFDDLSMEYDGERTFKFVMSRDDKRKEFEFTMPVILDRGVYTEGKSYAQGDSVTWGGSTWIAQVPDATDKPGSGTSKQWRLAVKRGSPGKDGALLVPRENKPVKLGV